MRQIAPGVFMFSRASIYQYILVNRRSITLIDTGLALFASSLSRSIQRSFPDRPLEMILITHGDGDHYGGATQLQSLCPDVKVAASLGEAAAMQDGKMSRGLKPNNLLEHMAIKLLFPLFKAKPVIATDILRPGQILESGLHVIDSVGHTPHHLSFFLPNERILFAGDSIVDKNGIPSPAYGYNCWDEAKSIVSFEKQMALQPLHLCCGHSYFNLSSQVV